MRVLGIESSCDETGIAIYDTEEYLLVHKIYSQIELHSEYGGVVPELASRDHIQKILPLINQVLNQAQLTCSEINAVAYTAGPGLSGALLVGASIGRSLAWALNIPSIAIHHMEGHLLSPLLEVNPPKFPFVSLLISGGHTLLVEVSGIGKYKLLGESMDDAVGEAFDKIAKILGLNYPGGKLLANLAEKGKPNKYKFPRPMTDRPGLNFSFSGLKTFAINTWRNCSQTEQDRADIALAFQTAAIETLVIKCRRALKQTKLHTLVVAGGVSANKALRTKLDLITDMDIYYPRLNFCGDNGAMIAFAGAMRKVNYKGEMDLGFYVRPYWSINDLHPP